MNSGRGILFGSVYDIDDDQMDPNPNSDQSLKNNIVISYREEDSIWTGENTYEQSVTPTHFYMNAMQQMTTSMANNLRSTYSIIYQDLEVSYCNYIKSAAEIVLDSNLGFNTDNILLNQTDIDLLIPPPTCRVPSRYVDGIPKESRYNTTEYFEYLVQINSFVECVLSYNAYPSYTKGVNCLEEYYVGSQDSSASPNFFDLSQNVNDLSNTLQVFYRIGPMTIDLSHIDDWRDYQSQLDISRSFTDVARKLRSVCVFLYTAMTRNYVRMNRLKTCKNLETELYSQNLNVPRTWCDYTSCTDYGVEYRMGSLFVDDRNNIPQGQVQNCDTTTCIPSDTYPDPFYCDSERPCPGSYYCNFVNRRCYKTEERVPFYVRKNNTVCGYQRKIVDAMGAYGTVTRLLGTVANETDFSHKTYWPQTCEIKTTQTVNQSVYLDYGPVSFGSVCYSLVNDGYARFYSDGQYDCDYLGIGNETFYNAKYTYYVNDVSYGTTTKDITVQRYAAPKETWQLRHCNTQGVAPEYFGDYNYGSGVAVDFCYTVTNIVTKCPSNDNTGAYITDCQSAGFSPNSCGIDNRNDPSCRTFSNPAKTYLNCTLVSKPGRSCNMNGSVCEPCNDSNDRSTSNVNGLDACDPTQNSTRCAVFTVTYRVCGRQNPVADPGRYMICSSFSGCTSVNSTHACYTSVQDTVRIYTHVNNVTDKRCKDVRITSNGQSVDPNYVDPYKSVPSPIVYDVPPGYVGEKEFISFSIDVVTVSTIWI
jgi:hypothetical protein